MLLLYASVGISLMRYMWRNHRSEFHVVKHVMVPLLGTVVAGAAVYGNYNPMPAGVILWINAGFIAYVVAGTALAVYWRHRRPDVIQKLATATSE
jgi:hypothetical protein